MNPNAHLVKILMNQGSANSNDCVHNYAFLHTTMVGYTKSTKRKKNRKVHKYMEVKPHPPRQ